MDKSDIFTAELILIFSLVIDISRYFHCRVWITSDVSIHLTSLNVPHFRNSNAYNSVIYEGKHKVWVFIFLVRIYLSLSLYTALRPRGHSRQVCA